MNDCHPFYDYIQSTFIQNDMYISKIRIVPNMVFSAMTGDNDKGSDGISCVSLHAPRSCDPDQHSKSISTNVELSLASLQL